MSNGHKISRGSINNRIESKPVRYGENVYIGENCTIGCSSEKRISTEQDTTRSKKPVFICDDSIIMNHVIVKKGTTIGPDATIRDCVRIGARNDINSNTRVTHGAYVGNDAVLSKGSIVGGFVCTGSEIGENSRVMGSLVHEHTQPHKSWLETDEQAPKVSDNAVVGWNATVVGDVQIGSRCYIAAGATVTKDVPSNHVVIKENNMTHLDEWEGDDLCKFDEGRSIDSYE